jgi:hypothetical protein
MNADDSYLNERLAERRRQWRSGVAGVGLLLALGWGLLLSYPTPRPMAPEINASTTTASQSESLNGNATTALR